MKIRGKYNTCEVFTDNIDNETISQIISLLNMPYMKGEIVRIMPDCHAGKGCVIGTTMTLNNQCVVPNLVGVDIGCGMLALKLEETDIDLKELDRNINEKVPSGFSVHEHPMAIFDELKDIRCDINIDNANRSLGSLGGGNHFIEVDKDKDGCLWLVIHTGSRHLGIEVCTHYQKAGKNNNLKEEIEATILDLKNKGLEKEIESTIKKIKEKTPVIPKELAYIDGKLFDDYIHDMKITQEYAKRNRQIIAKIIIETMDLHIVDSFDTIHNYIDTDNMILRKGSISAQKGERVIIPMNMHDGSLICIGKGNPDWNYSAPHGAGRIMSRGKAKDNISLEEFQNSMDGIYSSSVCESTIDEAPQAYKPMEEIINNIEDTVDIIDIIKPVYNFKAS